jgi:uncharacterized protein (TIGR03437 family)
MTDQGRAAALNPDGSPNAANLGAPVGSEIAIFLTGLGAVTTAADGLSHVAAQVSASMGGRSAEVVYAGISPGSPGLYQVNVIVPQLAGGDYPVQITAGGVAANTAVVSVQ